MATVDECRAALHKLAERMLANAAASATRLDFDRTLACRVTDLDAAFHGRLSEGRLLDLDDGDDAGAKIRLTATSDDLVDLVEGRLNAGSAWASGRIRIDAGFLDLIKLRKLL